MNRIAIAASAIVTTLLVACREDLAPAKCGEIPSGGCPRRGDGCRDPSCTALYVCSIESTWKLDRTCDPRDASAPLVDAVAPGIDAGARRDATTSVPGASGGPGCEDLAAPDCSLSAGLACGQGCCGCEDLFVCESGGWSLWGSCSAGEIIPDTRDH